MLWFDLAIGPPPPQPGGRFDEATRILFAGCGDVFRPVRFARCEAAIVVRVAVLVVVVGCVAVVLRIDVGAGEGDAEEVAGEEWVVKAVRVASVVVEL